MAMYGSWSAVTFGGAIFAALFVLGLLLAPWGAGVALIVALVLAAAATLFLGARRGVRDEGESRERPGSGSAEEAPQNPRTGGAPVSGEGSPPSSTPRAT